MAGSRQRFSPLTPSIRSLPTLLLLAIPVRNTVMLLSLEAGLRAGETANSIWPMVLDAIGELGPTIASDDKAAKKSSGVCVRAARYWKRPNCRQ